jgi:tartrate-resistant acid phosphatase type 5
MRRSHLALAVTAFLAACATNPSPQSYPSPERAPMIAAENPVCAQIRAASAPTQPVAVPVLGSRLRVIALGDFGDGLDDQKAVANAMDEYRKRHPADPLSFGLTLGDNFYEEGLQGRNNDIPWKKLWEDQYAKLGILFFASLGNHDYSDTSPDREIKYTSPSWCMPRHFYTFTAGPVQFFALDTEPLTGRRGDREQLEWLDRVLTQSSAPWKIVYGHHPVLSNGDHGDDEETANVKKHLLPKLRGRATIYLTGHDHDLQRLAADGVHLFVAGAGGHEVRPLRQDPSPGQWGVGEVLGFAVLEATEQQLVVQLIDQNQTPLCTFSLDRTGKADTTGCQMK